MPEYTLLTVLAVLAVVVAELVYFRSGIFRTTQYWWSMVIIVAFQILVDGSLQSSLCSDRDLQPWGDSRTAGALGHSHRRLRLRIRHGDAREVAANAIPSQDDPGFRRTHCRPLPGRLDGACCSDRLPCCQPATPYIWCRWPWSLDSSYALTSPGGGFVSPPPHRPLRVASGWLRCDRVESAYHCPSPCAGGGRTAGAELVCIDSGAITCH
jgi:hypothetical protein